MNKHNRTIIGDRDALAVRVAELEEKNDHLEGVISDKDALIAHYERQLAAVQRALDGVKAQAQPRIRVANGNGTA